MVSKASDDFPDPDKPVITTSWSLGISTSTFFRLCSRAPRTEMVFCIDTIFRGFVESQIVYGKRPADIDSYSENRHSPRPISASRGRHGRERNKRKRKR